MIQKSGMTLLYAEENRESQTFIIILSPINKIMNKIYNKFLLIIGVAVLFSASDAGMLNLDPKGEFPEASVWEDPNPMEAALNDIYLGTGHGSNEMMISSLADESHCMHAIG